MVAPKKKTPAPERGLAERMTSLFKGNQRSTGVFDPKSGKMHTEYTAPTEEDFARHIAGTKGVGVVPIDDEGFVMWAAIDIDNHDDASGEDIPIAPIADAITHNKLPLLACRSKSGGVHVYLFLEKPMSAARVRASMVTWAAALGHAGVEVFPKQVALFNQKEGKKSLGNWINLPYLGGDETMRYCFHGGKKLTLAEFLNLAEKMKQTPVGMNAAIMHEHPQAPPCVQRMMMEGVAEGSRNEALYNTVVYLRKMNPMGYEEKANEINQVMFNKPIARGEATRTINSAAKPDYRYRCNEEPIKSLCDRATCLKRKHGISSEEIERMDAISALPVFGSVVKYLSDPVRWELEVDGKKITNIGTAQLLDWKFMREMIADKLTRIVPLIKNQEWERVLQPLMAECKIVETPEDASVGGVVRARLREFAEKTDLQSPGTDMQARKAILRGMPVVVDQAGERVVAFRAQDFINYLKRTKSEELKGVNLWFAIREAGTRHERMRIVDKVVSVWTIPLDSLGFDPVEAPEIKSRL